MFTQIISLAILVYILLWHLELLVNLYAQMPQVDSVQCSICLPCELMLINLWRHFNELQMLWLLCRCSFLWVPFLKPYMVDYLLSSSVCTLFTTLTSWSSDTHMISSSGHQWHYIWISSTFSYLCCTSFRVLDQATKFFLGSNVVKTLGCWCARSITRYGGWLVVHIQ